MPQKMLVGDKDTVLLIPAYEIAGIPQGALPTGGVTVPITAMTTAILNYYIPIVTPSGVGARWGGNVTCAVLDDYKLAMKDSATKDVRTICSVGQAQELTFYNYDASMNFLRDIDPTDVTSEFNLPVNLVNTPDIAYIVAHRVGYSRLTAAAVSQEWNFYYVWTDNTIPAAADGDYQAIGESFIPKGIVNFKYILGA